MKALQLLLIVLFFGSLSGCILFQSSNTEEDVEIQKAYYAAKSAQAVAESTAAPVAPTFELICGTHENACKGVIARYNSPLAKKASVIIERAHTTNENAKDASIAVLPEVFNTGLIGFGIYEFSNMIEAGFDRAGNGNTVNNTSNNINGEDVNVTNTTSVVGDTSNKTDTRSFSSISNSNNLTDRHDQSDSYNAVSEPTVVSQPPYNDPIIVTVPGNLE